MIDQQKKSEGKGHQPKEIKRENNGPVYNPDDGYKSKQHCIRENETLAGIARRYNLSLDELLRLNNWKLVDSSKGILSQGGERS